MSKLEQLKKEAERLRMKTDRLEDEVAYREARKKYLLAQAEYYARRK